MFCFAFYFTFLILHFILLNFLVFIYFSFLFFIALDADTIVN